MSNTTQGLYRAFSNGVKNRKLIPANGFEQKAFEFINKDPDKDYYESLYLYNEEHYKQFKATNSLAGMREGVKTDRIVLDFDSKANVELAQQDAIVAVERLTSVFNPDAIRIYSSGSKGYHIDIHVEQLLTRKEFEAITTHFAGDLNTFDPAVKDEQRLFRFPLTRHNSTKRFKIPLTVEQLKTLTTEQIQKLSMNVDLNPFFDIMETYVSTALPESVKQIKITKKDTPKAELIMQTDRPDMSRKPRHLTAAKFALQEGYFEEGERNEACMILATTYKYLGYNQEHTYNIIKATLRMRATRMGLPEYDKGELWNTIITPVYSPLWKGGTYTEEDGLLKRTIERFNLDKVDISDVGLVALSSLGDSYKNFAVNIKKNTIKLGIDEIDQKVIVTTSMFVCLLASPGAGKTSISMGILNTLSKNNEKAIFFSLDMGIPQVYQRLIQRHTGHKSNQITENYENNRIAEIQNYQEILSNEYSNVKFCFKGGLTCEQIKATVIAEKDITGVLPKLVVIDYLECIQTPYSDSTQAKAFVATALKNLANELGICVFLLVQPAKVSGDPSNELTSYSQIKGSGVLAEASTVVFTLSRPGFSPKHPENDNYATINVVKNRLGELSSTDLHWEGLTGNIRSLSHEEEADLKALRSEINAEKNAAKREDLY
jgi:KaiC/GvpD/RAD55 family RecA-like ATPase